MRIPALPIIASFALLAAPALAQTSTTPSTQHQPSGTSTSPSMSGGQKLSMDTQQKIRQSLESSGFKDVRVAPESYVVHAQAPDGSRIVMMMSPDEVAGVIESGASSQPSGSTQSGTGGASHSPMPNNPSRSGPSNTTR